MAGADILARQLNIARDHRQRIVEFMRDATRERAQRFHLLRLTQLCFECDTRDFRIPARCDITKRPHATNLRFIQHQRRGITLKYPTVLETHGIDDRFAGLIQQLHSFQKRFGIRQLTDHVFQ